MSFLLGFWSQFVHIDAGGDEGEEVETLKSCSVSVGGVERQGCTGKFQDPDTIKRLQKLSQERGLHLTCEYASVHLVLL